MLTTSPCSPDSPLGPSAPDGPLTIFELGTQFININILYTGRFYLFFPANIRGDFQLNLFRLCSVVAESFKLYFNTVFLRLPLLVTPETIIHF